MADFVERLGSAGAIRYGTWVLVTAVVVALLFVYRRRIAAVLPDAPGDWRIFLVVVAFFVAVALPVTPTGDEPHYLIITQSLLADRDLDLRNNYEHMDYLAYYPEPIPDPHVNVVGASWYSVHAIALPLLAAPWFAVAGRSGVVVMLVLMTVAGIRILWSALIRARFTPISGIVASGVAGFTLPIASLSGQVFAEIPAFLLVALAIHALLAPALTKRELAGLLIGVVTLPWLHPRYALLGAALVLSALLLHNQRSARPVVLIAGCAWITSVAGIVLFHLWSGIPLAGPSAVMMSNATLSESWLETLSTNFLGHPEVGLMGSIFDQQSGLLFASPVYVFALPGVVFLWQRWRTLAIASVAIFLSVYLPAGAYSIWYGGFASPARLLAPVVPVLAIGIAATLDGTHPLGKRLLKVLAVPSFVHAYLMVTLPSFTRYGDPATQHNFFIAALERLMDLDLTPVFPSFRNVTETTWLTLVLYVVAIAAVSAIVLRPRHERFAASPR